MHISRKCSRKCSSDNPRKLHCERVGAPPTCRPKVPEMFLRLWTLSSRKCPDLHLVSYSTHLLYEVDIIPIVNTNQFAECKRPCIIKHRWVYKYSDSDTFVITASAHHRCGFEKKLSICDQSVDFQFEFKLIVCVFVLLFQRLLSNEEEKNKEIIQEVCFMVSVIVMKRNVVFLRLLSATQS